MKGSTFALSETFMKILTTAYVAIVLLGIFFAITQYHIIFVENRTDRETLNAGNAVLSSCIAESDNSGKYSVKGLLSEEKIKEENLRDPFRSENIPCLRYEKGIYIEIYNANKQLLYSAGNSNVCDPANPFPSPCDKKLTATTTTFPAALNRTTEVIPVIVNVSIGVTT